MKRPRGRPVGKGRKAIAKWEPTQWRAKYDIMVEFHVQGYKHKEIAEMLGSGVTPQTVMNVLTCEMAKPHIIEARKRQVGRMANDQNRRLERLQARALDITEKVLMDDSLVEESPMAMLDRSMKFLQNRGLIEDENKRGGMNIEKAIVLSKEDSARLIAGLAKSDEIKLLKRVN